MRFKNLAQSLLTEQQLTTNNEQRTLKDMKITKEEVLYVARLARLDLDADAIDKFAGQIDEILGYIEKLNQVDTEGIQPTSHAISLTNAFRDDEPRQHLERERALANAPEQEEGQFVVPKIVG
jgi:aspartyl-tRNA(Asn)/glutamyl-tRNA(Gln) amidotransferase subunit C